MVNLYNFIIDYINKNKNDYNIDYFATIDSLRELLDEIEQEYKNVENASKKGYFEER